MIAVDTNVLVRLFVIDNPQQVRAAKRLTEDLEKRGERAYVSEIVFVEIAWVLRSRYSYKREQIVFALGKLLMASELRFDEPARLLRALQAYGQGPGDLADYVIREHAVAAGCATVATFDGDLHKEAMFSAP